MPLPDGIEIWAPLIILPLPEDLDPERALSSLIEVLKLAAEHAADGGFFEHAERGVSIACRAYSLRCRHEPND